MGITMTLAARYLGGRRMRALLTTLAVVFGVLGAVLAPTDPARAFAPPAGLDPATVDAAVLAGYKAASKVLGFGAAAPSASNKTRFHLADGPEQPARDAQMAAGATDWSFSAVAWIIFDFLSAESTTSPVNVTVCDICGTSFALLSPARSPIVITS